MKAKGNLSMIRRMDGCASLSMLSGMPFGGPPTRAYRGIESGLDSQLVITGFVFELISLVLAASMALKVQLVMRCVYVRSAPESQRLHGEFWSG